MKKRIKLKAPVMTNVRMSHSARTGDHCSVNGWWAPFNDVENPRFISEGSIMPSANGGPSNWKLVISNQQQSHIPRYDLPSRGISLDTI